MADGTPQRAKSGLYVRSAPGLKLRDRKVQGLKSQFVAGERGAVEWVMAATHEEDMQGMPATHKKFSVRGATVVDLDGTKIRRNSDYWDLSTFLKQIGLRRNVE